MIKVEQQEVDKITGDCMRASIASVLECDLQVVPHITRIASRVPWFSVMYYFMVAHKYLYRGIFYPHEGRRKLLNRHSFNGFYLAGVKSRTYAATEDDVSHMVVIDRNFIVIHDPHPDKKWQGEHLWGNPNFENVYKFEKMNKTDINYWHYVN